MQLSGSDCKETCGDGKNYLTYTDECDDGNTRSGDGCSSTCVKEFGYVCVGRFPDLCTTNITTTTAPVGTLTRDADNNLYFSVSKELLTDLTASDVSVTLAQNYDFSYTFAMVNNTYYAVSTTFHESFDKGTVATFSLLTPENVMDSIHQEITKAIYTVELDRVEIWKSEDEQATTIMLFIYHAVLGVFGLVAIILGMQHFFWEFWASITFFSFSAMQNVEPPSLMSDYMRYVIPFSWVRHFISNDNVDSTGQGTSGSIQRYGLESSLFLTNAVHVLIIVGVLTMLYGFNLLGAALRQGTLKNLSQKFGSLFAFSIPLRTALMFYFELSVYIYVQLAKTSFQTFFIIFSYVSSALVAFGLLGFTIWLTSFIVQNWHQMRTRQEDNLFFRRFRALFFELRENSGLQIYCYQLLQLARKVVFLFTLVALDSAPIVQLIVNAAHTAGFVVWVIVVRPYDIRLQIGYTLILELAPLAGIAISGFLLQQTTVSERLNLAKIVRYPPLILAGLATGYMVMFYYAKKAKFRKVYEPTPMPVGNKVHTQEVFDDDYEYWGNADRQTADRQANPASHTQPPNSEIDHNPVVFFKHSKREGITWLPKKFEQVAAFESKD